VKRRLFLKGVAGASLAAPFLGSLYPRTAKAAGTGPQRLVIFYTNNGCLTNRWFPKVENGAIDAAALAGTTLAPLSDVANKLLFPRGLALYPKGTVNGYFDPHDQGMGSKLTCAPIKPDGDHYATGPSLDWLAASLVNPGTKSPLVLSVGNAFANVKGIVSYKPGALPTDMPTAYSPEVNPKNVYTALTGLFQGSTPTAADYRVMQGKSIIDLCRADIDALAAKNMSMKDKQRLSDWKSLMRQVETTVVPTTKACNATSATSLGITDAALTAAGKRDTKTAYTLGIDMMINLIGLTMMCDANRMIILQMPGFVTFSGIETPMPTGPVMMMHTSDHHGLSHRNGSVAVGGTCAEGVIENINQIDTFYTSKYSKLVHMLNSIDENGAPMLDNSMVMWLPELADGNAHNNNNLPIVIAGSAGGYLKQGASVNLDTRTLGTGNSEASCSAGNTSVGFNTGSNTGTVPLNKLYVTLLNALGAKANADGVAVAGGTAPVTKFGVMDYTDAAGTPGIKNPGELTSLKA
jgi:Protein of unknown function (DUF1552)